jgi:hypothetical protein
MVEATGLNSRALFSSWIRSTQSCTHVCSTVHVQTEGCLLSCVWTYYSPLFSFGGHCIYRCVIDIWFIPTGMGMTLTLDDLKTTLLMPKELAAGFILQYTVRSPHFCSSYVWILVIIFSDFKIHIHLLYWCIMLVYLVVRIRVFLAQTPLRGGPNDYVSFFLTHMTTWVGDLVCWRLNPDHWGWQIRREGIKWSCQIAQSCYVHVVVDTDLDHRLVRVSTSLIDTHLEHEEHSGSLKSIGGSVRPMLILFFVWYTLVYSRAPPGKTYRGGAHKGCPRIGKAT